MKQFVVSHRASAGWLLAVVAIGVLVPDAFGAGWLSTFTTCAVVALPAAGFVLGSLLLLPQENAEAPSSLSSPRRRRWWPTAVRSRRRRARVNSSCMSAIFRPKVVGSPWMP